MKNFKKGRVVIYSVLLALLILAFRPIYNVSLDDTEMVTGTIEAIKYNKHSQDIHLRLVDDDTNYYINRGLEIIENAEDNFSELINDDVEILYAKHWTPLDPFSKNKHVSRVTYGDTVLFDEIAE